MSTNGLCCPHGRPVSILQKTGITIYQHAEDGSFCDMLNAFTISPSDILKSISRSILAKKEFDRFLTLDMTLEEACVNLYGESGTKHRFTELLLAFKHSQEVRQQIYRQIEKLSKGTKREIESAKRLYSLVIILLSTNRLKTEERKYQQFLGEFYLASGHSYFKLKNRLKIFEITGGFSAKNIGSLDKDMEFHKKYIYPLRRFDNYPIAFAE